MNHHTKDPVCPLCEEKIQTGHPMLQAYWEHLKSQFETAHLSWVFRGEADQNTFFREGKTRVTWPDSAHNQMKDGLPCARAMDLFEIRPDGVAYFGQDFSAKIWAYCSAAGFSLLWGGNFKHLGDADHFQLGSSIPS